jgi:hypothetical protein
MRYRTLVLPLAFLREMVFMELPATRKVKRATTFEHEHKQKKTFLYRFHVNNSNYKQFYKLPQINFSTSFIKVFYRVITMMVILVII